MKTPQRARSIREFFGHSRPARTVRVETFCNRARWRRFRRVFLDRNPLCIDPFGIHRGRPTPATDVDHIIPRRERPDLWYTESNVQALCKGCHSRKTSHEKRDA